MSKASPDPVKEVRSYAFHLPPFLKRLLEGRSGGGDDPLARQYIPQAAEQILSPGEDSDPIGDYAHAPVPSIVHRYPDRALLKLTHACAVYCRYCFRRDMVGPGGIGIEKDEIAQGLDYIENHKEIWEVILTGGDPLIVSPLRLAAVLERLEAIEHVKTIRIHTRVPLACPEKMTPDFCALFARGAKPVYMALHVNHAAELTREVRGAIANLRRAGVILLSQSVLLRGVNDNVEALENLFRALVEAGVKPYYLHHPDKAPGTAHFRLAVAEGQALVRALQGRVSGICLPAYMLDIPGGHGKVPLTPCYARGAEDGTYILTDFNGQDHSYKDE